MRRSVRRLSAAIGLLGAAALIAVGCAPAYEGSRAVIAGGATGGVYFSYGQQYARVLTDNLRVDAEVVPTEGSVDNLRRVASGNAVFGFAQADAAADAVAGAGAFGEPLPIRAVARIYDEYVHVVVPRGSDIRRLDDLAGRTVSLGAPGSGVQVISERILAAVGLEATDVDDRQLGIDESIEALQAGRIEAFVWVGGVPTPGIESLSRSFPLRLLSVDSDVVEAVNAGHAGVYRISDFPLLAYGIEQHTVTMTVPNYIITSTGTPDSLVRDAVAALFDARSRIAGQVPAAEFLDRRQAIFTEPVELHDGAVDYYVRSHG